MLMNATQMGCHLIFWWVGDPSCGNLCGWKVSISVGWCPLQCALNMRIGCWLHVNWLSFEKYLVEVQSFKKMTDHFRGIYKVYMPLMQTTKEVNVHPCIAPHICTSWIGSTFWGSWWSLLCWGFGDAKEGIRFRSLEVVGEESWIDQV